MYCVYTFVHELYVFVRDREIMWTYRRTEFCLSQLSCPRNCDVSAGMLLNWLSWSDSRSQLTSVRLHLQLLPASLHNQINRNTHAHKYWLMCYKHELVQYISLSLLRHYYDNKSFGFKVVMLHLKIVLTHSSRIHWKSIVK